ncbi:MAG: PASTA domain-containing protein [Muribaculaceae bacterium]|nr:PASTA domain-containing protein [Muribaculaceae bacterium]
MEKEKGNIDARGLMGRHPVLVNLIIIILVGFIGIWIVYLSIALFTRHGQSDTVPGVENMSYTRAVETLHERGFRVDIRDSLYVDHVKPGYVIEQFPKSGSVVKPGRKIFLYINAVHPKEVIIDQDNNPREDALRSFSFRQGMARLEELGFKDIRVVKVLGDNDCIVKILANGRTVKKMQKVPLNAKITVEVYDGRLVELRDSLQNAEYYEYLNSQSTYDGGGETDYGYGYGGDSGSDFSSSTTSSQSSSSSSSSQRTEQAPTESAEQSENIFN